MLTIYSIQKRQTGYGHWKIMLDVETADGDSEIITCTTTNSRAIDGHDGAEQALASECLRDNDLDEDEYDLSSLEGGEDED
jgi:hypothetical protein